MKNKPYLYVQTLKQIRDNKKYNSFTIGFDIIQIENMHRHENDFKKDVEKILGKCEMYLDMNDDRESPYTHILHIKKIQKKVENK